MPYGSVLRTEDVQQMLEEGEVVVGGDEDAVHSTDDPGGDTLHIDYKGDTPCPNPYCEDGTIRYENIDDYGYPFGVCGDCGLSMDFTGVKDAREDDDV